MVGVEVDALRSNGLAMRTLCGGAARVQFQSLPGEFEGPHLRDDLAYTDVDNLVRELQHTATVDADDMIMRVIIARHRVEAGLAVAELSGFGKPILDQQFQGSVHGCIADSWRHTAYILEQLFDADVLVDAKESLDDGIALTGRLEAGFGQSLIESRDNRGNVGR